MMIDILDYKIEKRKEMKEVKKRRSEGGSEARREIETEINVAETGVACQASVVTLNKECQTDHVVTTEYR